MANGLWWISRGRAGWIAKHSEKLKPDDSWNDDDFQVWLNEVSDQGYYGADAIKTVWDDIPAENVLNAKRTILFAEPAYDGWTIESNNVISVDAAHDVLLDLIREEERLTGDVFGIVSMNLMDILQSLSPPQNWTITDSGDADQMFLPSNSFSRDEYMEGLVKTVSDFISSFEKRGDARQEAIRVLGELDIQLMTSKWSDLFDPIEKADKYDLDPWTVDPSIVREAYPPLALNPEELTDRNTAELREQVSEPIQFDPELSLRGGRITVRLCPTESAFNTAIEKLESHSDVTETTVLLLPDDDETRDWTVPEHARRLQEFDLLTVEYIGGQRLWDLVLQLDEYMETHEFDPPLSQGVVRNEIIPEEPRDQVRNTINALFPDLNRLAKDVVRESRSSFLQSYSLDDDNGLIWEDQMLATRDPFYGTTSRADTPKEGIEYGIVFSTKSYNEGIEYEQLVRGLLNAYNREFINQRSFRYTYFLRRSFEENGEGLTEFVNEVRKKYVTDTGELKAPVLRLQRALGYLSELNDQSANHLYNILKDINSESQQIEVIAGKTAGEMQSDRLFWGLLLDWSVRSSNDDLLEDLNTTKNKLEKLSSMINEIDQQIGFINNRFKPPGDTSIEDQLTVRTDRIDEYQENIKTVTSGFDKVVEQTQEFPDLSSSIVVLWSATSQYNDLMGETVGDLQNLFGRLELYSNMNELKSEYNTLRTWLGTTDSLQEVSLNKSDALEQTDTLGEYIFDLPTRVDKSEIPIEQVDLLEDIDDMIEDDTKQISKLNSKAEKIETLAEKANSSSQEIIENLTLFADRTANLGDSE